AAASSSIAAASKCDNLTNCARPPAARLATMPVNSPITSTLRNTSAASPRSSRMSCCHSDVPALTSPKNEIARAKTQKQGLPSAWLKGATGGRTEGDGDVLSTPSWLPLLEPHPNSSHNGTPAPSPTPSSTHPVRQPAVLIRSLSTPVPTAISRLICT